MTPDRFLAFAEPEPNSGCWLWTGNRHRQGYGRTKVKSVQVYAHRTAWQLFRGAIPDGLDVLHSCDNPPCVNPSHLFLGTHRDNMADMFRKQRRHSATGERNGGGGKLSRAAVESIRAAKAAGEQQKIIAARFGVHECTVSRIVLGKLWTN